MASPVQMGPRHQREQVPLCPMVEASPCTACSHWPFSSCLGQMIVRGQSCPRKHLIASPIEQLHMDELLLRKALHELWREQVTWFIPPGSHLGIE